MGAKLDPTGKTVSIDPADSMLRVDGIPVCKIFEREGVLILQFCDKDRWRSNCRKTRFVEVNLKSFISRLNS